MPMIEHAQLILPYDSLGGLSLFEVADSYPPCTIWDWKTPSDAPPTENFNFYDARIMANQQHKA